MRTPILAAALLLALAAPPGALAEGEAPWLGTWRLDPARSTARSGPSQYARTTLRIEAVGDGLLVVYDMVGTRGGRTHIEWRGALDGRDYPVQGVDYVMTNAYRVLDERSYEIAVKLDGRPVATTRVSVSPDGATLTAVTVERDESRVLTTTAVHARQ
jgi:hypothetical protein